MQTNRDLIEKLHTYTLVKEKDIVQSECNMGNMTFSDLRDVLIGKGKILEEDFEKKIYVAAIEAGVADMNVAIVAIQWTDSEKLYITAYAREGLIKQHTAEKAIAKIKEQIKQSQYSQGEIQ